MHEKPRESDWKAFGAIVPELRERYLRERNLGLVAILRDETLTPTEQFWNAEERMTEIAKILRTCLDGHSRSRMVEYMMLMYRNKMLSEADLANFSKELREQVLGWAEI